MQSKRNPNGTNAQRPEYGTYSPVAEIERLRNFVEKSGLWIPNKFYENVRIGDVIDLYTLPPELKQLYCNDQFRELCSYSEEDMRALPFPQLFWRSDEIQKQLIHRTTEVSLQGSEAQPWNIANHELVETAHPRKRTFEINLGWVAPCFKRGSQERAGFVSSLKVELIFEWPDFDAEKESA